MDRKEIEAQLRRDLLERDGKTFVFERKEGRLGWEKTIPEGSGYSSYITDAKDDEDLMKKAYDLACKAIVSMNAPYKVKVRLNPGNGSCSFTDFKQVAVSTSVFDEEGLSIGQKLDTFLGYTVHEGCHLLYTTPCCSSSDRLTHDFENIIEDERIEHLCGERTPGLAKFLAAAKYHAFDRYVGAVGEGTDVITRFVNAVLALVRYPKVLVERDIDEFGELLLKVRDILTPYPEDTAGSAAAARKIVELIRDFADECRKESEEGTGGEGSTGTDGKRGSTGESGKGEPSGSGESGEYASSGEAGPDGDGTGTGKPAGRPASGSEGDPLCGRSVEDIMSDLEDALGSLSRNPGEALSRDDASRAVRTDDMLESICDGSVERGVSRRNAYILPYERHRSTGSLFDSSLARVRKCIPAVRSVLRCNGQELTHNLLGMRSGRFDCNKLAEAYQGSDCIYRQQSTRRADNIAVCVLIDESGSMAREGFGTERPRIDCARDTAVLLTEALRGIPNIDLYVYGHSADEHGSGSVELLTYVEHGRGDRKALGSCSARSNNADGYAILEAAARVRRYTQDKCLMFVISDGEPAANCYYGDDGIPHTRKCVEQISRQGFAPVQISIGGDDPRSMFRNYVMCRDLSRLPQELGKMVKAAVLKNS